MPATSTQALILKSSKDPHRDDSLSIFFLLYDSFMNAFSFYTTIAVYAAIKGFFVQNTFDLYFGKTLVHGCFKAFCIKSVSEMRQAPCRVVFLYLKYSSRCFSLSVIDLDGLAPPLGGVSENNAPTSIAALHCLFVATSAKF